MNQVFFFFIYKNPEDSNGALELVLLTSVAFFGQNRLDNKRRGKTYQRLTHFVGLYNTSSTINFISSATLVISSSCGLFNLDD